jgi:FAD binding domain
MLRKVFSANPARIGRFDGPPTSDAVPGSLVDGTRGDLKADLIALLGKENVLHRAIDLVRYASDASPYRLVPQVVVLPRATDDIVKLFRYCRETGRHATFRAAGTSLNGQSQSDDILIETLADKITPPLRTAIWRSASKSSASREGRQTCYVNFRVVTQPGAESQEHSDDNKEQTGGITRQPSLAA